MKEEYHTIPPVQNLMGNMSPASMIYGHTNVLHTKFSVAVYLTTAAAESAKHDHLPTLGGKKDSASAQSLA